MGNEEKEALKSIKNKLDLSHLEEKTTLFDNLDDSLDKNTLSELKERFRLYFTTHIQADVDVILKIDNPLNLKQ